eukprot:CAMPEP_0113945150 /NCGR_PEP_ID=MMETSP1339-20121228/38968_1 /TAXON_ID=94617 /ORGANISM="Fibrocapsa japonica" /LENGTH=112 /DNA_ID=CAMNT_0000950577 /DNA_START=142 /DNA_END=476 /DNA_ORIENTATION=- /assembly_acc=CAM_ASM_000762
MVTREINATVKNIQDLKEQQWSGQLTKERAALELDAMLNKLQSLRMMVVQSDEAEEKQLALLEKRLAHPHLGAQARSKSTEEVKEATPNPDVGGGPSESGLGSGGVAEDEVV